MTTATVMAPARSTGAKTTGSAKIPKGVKTEKDVLKRLGLVSKERLTAADHKNIAAAARQVSKALRKSDPQLANHLYYVHYKHIHAAGKSRK